MDAARQILATHRSLSIFLAKMVACYAVWFVLYDLWLLPDGRLDTWLSHGVASATASVLHPFYETAFADGRVVWITRESGVNIANGCNGLSALSLFIGFVIAYPGSWARRALFIPLGVLALIVTNVVRCAILLMVSHHIPSMFDSVHGFHALFVFYVVIFLLWVAWANWGEPKRDASDGGASGGSPAPSGTPSLATA